MRNALITLCALALVLFLVVALAVNQRRDAVKTVKDDSAPSILAAQKIHAYLADMDANAANELISLPGQNTDAVRDYAKDHTIISINLVKAAKNITYQPETEAVIKLQDGLVAYDQAIQQARDFHERGDPAMLAAYRRAYDILQHTLFPAADALDKVNNDELTKAYNASNLWSGLTLILTLLAGIGLIAVQVRTQLYLTAKMRRIINPPLLAATVLSVGYLLFTLLNFVAVGDHLKVAKEDAFDSVRALWQAKATASDANADESRWLFDRAQASLYEQEYQKKKGLILSPPPELDMSPETMARLYPKSEQKGGFLAVELNNVTFEGELDSVQKAINIWAKYLKIDGRIRSLENSGSLADARHAVALCIGNDPDESNWAFNQFDAALMKTLEINQTAFDLNLKQASDKLSPYDIWNPVLLIGIIVLTVLGLMPRLREYAI